MPLFDPDLYKTSFKMNGTLSIKQHAHPKKKTYARDWSSGTKDKYGEIVWSYGARRNQAGSFYCTHMGSCQRLKNGNTLVVMGPSGIIIEVTDQGEEVWRWVSPLVNLTKGECGAVSLVRQGDQRPEHVNVGIFQAWRYSGMHFTRAFLQSHPDLLIALQGESNGKLHYLEPYP